MLEYPLAPYLEWAKTRPAGTADLAASNLLACALEELPGARDVVALSVANERGYAPVVEAIAAHYAADPARVVTAPGCSAANFVVIAGLVRPGDDVLIERPTYDPLVGACRLMGADVRRFDRAFDEGYRIDVERVRSALTARTRLVVVTNPHNPSGVVAGEDVVRGLGRAAAEVGAQVLVDEVYLDASNLLSGSAGVRPAARLGGPLVSTSSLTKSYGLAGLRCGWAIVPGPLAGRLWHTRDVIDSISSAPADSLSALAWSRLGPLAERARGLLAGNVDRMRSFLSSHPQIAVASPPASSICFPRLVGAEDATSFARRLFDEHGVAVVPGRFFDSPAHFRISLAGRPETLDAGLAALDRALSEW
jgi:aspartate/methionine/tyrosine aminotransferase